MGYTVARDTLEKEVFCEVGKSSTVVNGQVADWHKPTLLWLHMTDSAAAAEGYGVAPLKFLQASDVSGPGGGNGVAIGVVYTIAVRATRSCPILGSLLGVVMLFQGFRVYAKRRFIWHILVIG
jgi:hypothetical protein